jgi:leucyl aminopeptidase
VRVHIFSPTKPSNVENLILLRPEGKDPFGHLHIPAALRMTLNRCLASVHHTGREGEVFTVPVDSGGVGRVTLIGLGKADKVTLKKARAAIRAAIRQAGKNGDKKVAIGLSTPLVGAGSSWENLVLFESCLLSDYEFRTYRTSGDAPRYPEEVRWVPRVDEEDEVLEGVLKEARIVADSVRLVRDLGNTPSNDMTPTALGEAAKKIAKELDLKCQLWGRKELEKEGFGGLLAVNRGSDEEPCFIQLEYPGPKGGRRPKETICLVGKGLTFDSGGISIKPSAGMGEMKYDMCGGAAVLGAVRAVAALRLPFRVVGLVAATENMPDGKAYKPGDIVRTLSGKTVEIDNTDAEGRVVLADALTFAARMEPAAIVDFATLTGACMVALGLECSGLLSPDDLLAGQLHAAGEASGERLWRLPLWDDYRENLRSDWADIKNSGARWGGAIHGGIFLKEFVGSVPWAHLDIAGTANYEKEFGGLPVGASGMGVKLIVRFLKERSEAN